MPDARCGNAGRSVRLAAKRVCQQWALGLQQGHPAGEISHSPISSHASIISSCSSAGCGKRLAPDQLQRAPVQSVMGGLRCHPPRGGAAGACCVHLHALGCAAVGSLCRGGSGVPSSAHLHAQHSSHWHGVLAWIAAAVHQPDGRRCRPSSWHFLHAPHVGWIGCNVCGKVGADQ